MNIQTISSNFKLAAKIDHFVGKRDVLSNLKLQKTMLKKNDILDLLMSILGQFSNHKFQTIIIVFSRIVCTA